MTKPSPTIVRFMCFALMAVQFCYLGYGLYTFLDLHFATDETSMAAKDVLQPFMLVIMLISVALMFGTYAVQRRREHDHAVGWLVLIAALTLGPWALLLRG